MNKISHILIFAGMTALFAGCANTPKTAAENATETPEISENAGLPATREIGIVVMSDPAAKHCVVQLNSGENVKNGAELTVRRYDLTTAGRVLVEFVERRTLGCRVLDGEILEGQILTRSREM